MRLPSGQYPLHNQLLFSGYKCITHDPSLSAALSFRISDQGGGVEYDKIEKIWEYGYTSLAEQDDEADNTRLIMGRPRQYKIGGLGFGLPLSRLHARYFGTL